MSKKPLRIPQRTCVGCRAVKAKKELVRIVRRPTGEVEVDATGKVSGRGAYICPRVECLQAALKGKRLERALQSTVDEAVVRTLEERLSGAE